MKAQALHSAQGDDILGQSQPRLSNVSRVRAGSIPLIHKDVVERLLATMRQPMYAHRLRQQ